MRSLLLLIFFIVSNTAIAKTNYTLNCLQDRLPDKHCQKIQNNLALWKADIEKVAIETQIPIALFTAIIAVESHFNAQSHSKFGTIGLTQIQIKTAKSLGYNLEQLKDPHLNLQAGALYLKTLLKKHRAIDAAIIAYKSGRKVSQDKLSPSIRTYLQQVLGLYDYFARTEAGTANMIN